MALVTPRLLPEHLHAFVAGPNNRAPNTVRLLASVTAIRGDYATVTCGDHGDVGIILNRDTHIQVGRMVDLVGRVVEMDGVRFVYEFPLSHFPIESFPFLHFVFSSC